MKEEELRKIVRDTVHETLTGLGFSPKEPQQMQKYMIFLSELYESRKETKKGVRAAMIRFATPAFVVALWEGIKHFISKG